MTRLETPADSERSRELADLFWALGDPFRLSIVEFLRTAPRTVTEITEHVHAPQPNVSRHLKALRERGVLETSRKGKWVHYSLRPGAMSRMARWIGQGGTALRAPLTTRDAAADRAPRDEKAILFID
ncbi:MAG: winged helix-turn-helix transcriptional regulator [Gemmatimonadetes bacterium]|nr:winged helix-turn-helix transcriptional regulator [Gemmatimonadota bacterium]